MLYIQFMYIYNIYAKSIYLHICIYIENVYIFYIYLHICKMYTIYIHNIIFISGVYLCILHKYSYLNMASC